MNDRPHIAFTGKMGSGKSSAREVLEKMGWEWLAFATPLKEIAMLVWGPEALTDRTMLQRLGLLVREIDKDALVNKLMRSHELQQSLVEPRPTVVDDLRLLNEWWALLEADFVICRVNCAEELRIDRLQRNGKLQDLSQLQHESETAVDTLSPTFQIRNEGTHEELESSVMELLSYCERRA